MDWNTAPLVDNGQTFDVYTNGIARVDVLSGTVRITYASFQFDGDHVFRHVCAKMVWPLETLVRHGGRLSRFVADGKSGAWPAQIPIGCDGVAH